MAKLDETNKGSHVFEISVDEVKNMDLSGLETLVENELTRLRGLCEEDKSHRYTDDDLQILRAAEERARVLGQPTDMNNTGSCNMAALSLARNIRIQSKKISGTKIEKIKGDPIIMKFDPPIEHSNSDEHVRIIGAILVIHKLVKEGVAIVTTPGLGIVFDVKPGVKDERIDRIGEGHIFEYMPDTYSELPERKTKFAFRRTAAVRAELRKAIGGFCKSGFAISKFADSVLTGTNPPDSINFGPNASGRFDIPFSDGDVSRTISDIEERIRQNSDLVIELLWSSVSAAEGVKVLSGGHSRGGASTARRGSGYNRNKA